MLAFSPLSKPCFSAVSRSFVSHETDVDIRSEKVSFFAKRSQIESPNLLRSVQSHSFFQRTSEDLWWVPVIEVAVALS